MHTINIDNQNIFKTKSLYLNCYSVNSTVWKHLDKLFLKALCLNAEYYTVKNSICFIEIIIQIRGLLSPFPCIFYIISFRDIN